MPLPSGTKLGSYEVLAPIAAGWMGEVYRARDTKLNRDVALKVLPEEFAAHPQRLARFRREAQVLASLNLKTAVDSQRSRQALDLPRLSTAAHFTKRVTTAVASSTCG